MTEHDDEPIPGLPGQLPPGERILWQGSPDWRSLARGAFRTRWVAGYFAALALVALVAGGPSIGLLLTATVGVAGVALLHLLAWAAARTTIYTLTDRRIVLRIGIALNKCINLPLTLVSAADLSLHADGTGDVALRLAPQARVGYAALWPHARPGHFGRPQPMLRSIPDAARVGVLVARSCLSVSLDGRLSAVVEPSAPLFGEAVAA